MGKARRLIRGLARRDFLLAVGGTTFAILGLASALFTIAGRHFELGGTAALILGAVALSCLLQRGKLRTSQVAAADVLEPSFFDDPATYVRCPCSLALAAAAKRLASDCFSGDVTIAPDVFEQFRVKNPRILACLTDRNDALLGYFDAIPLTDAFAKSLIGGVATEEDITHEDVLDIDGMARCGFLFVSGFAVVGPESHAGKRNASILTWALLRYLEAHYSAVGPLVFALAATPSGDEILKRFRLAPSDGAQRRDGYRLYSITLTDEAVVRRLACIPDWSGICRLDWAGEQTGRGAGTRPAPPPVRTWELSPGAAAP